MVGLLRIIEDEIMYNNLRLLFFYVQIYDCNPLDKGQDTLYSVGPEIFGQF